MNKGIKTDESIKVSRLEKNQVYHSKGIDSSATHTYYYVTDKLFFVALIWENAAGICYMEEYVYAIQVDVIKDMTLEDAYEYIAYLVQGYFDEEFDEDFKEDFEFDMEQGSSFSGAVNAILERAKSE